MLYNIISHSDEGAGVVGAGRFEFDEETDRMMMERRRGHREIAERGTLDDDEEEEEEDLEY